MSNYKINKNHYTYDHINYYNGMIVPSTVHTIDDYTTYYFAKYLLQRAISVFKWDLPEDWDHDYFLYTLYCWGYIGVFYTPEFGNVCQECSLYGYNIYYRPTDMRVYNPIMHEIERKINVDCTIIKLQPDYSGILDIVLFYATKLALISQSFDVNLVNTKVAFVFGVDSKAQEQTFKEMYDNINSGQPATFLYKKFNEDDNMKDRWTLFNQDVKANYIANELMQEFKNVTAMFDQEIGISNFFAEKKERLITSEINSNNETTKTKVDMWLQNIQREIKRANKMLGLKLKCDWRYDNGNVQDNLDRDVQLRLDDI